MKSGTFFKILLYFCVLICTSCTNVPARIEEELKANCDCEKIERYPYVRESDSLVIFDLYGCKFKENGDLQESIRIMEILQAKVHGICEMKDKLVFQFHVKEDFRDIIKIHSYKRCVPQFMDF